MGATNFLFIPCSRRVAKRLAKGGGRVHLVDETAGPGAAPDDTAVIATRSLEQALTFATDRILVASVTERISDDDGPASRDVESDQLLNIRPYRDPRPVAAAGGLVVRSRAGLREVLLIHRRGLWDLPKGKLDPGETIEECAVREVREEVGIDALERHDLMGTTTHCYEDRKGFAVKTTHWYRMSTDAEHFVPQAAEAIDAVRWFDLEQAESNLAFETLRSLVRQVRLASGTG